jgi:hypothetical protein
MSIVVRNVAEIRTILFDLSDTDCSRNCRFILNVSQSPTETMDVTIFPDPITFDR